MKLGNLVIVTLRWFIKLYCSKVIVLYIQGLFGLVLDVVCVPLCLCVCVPFSLKPVYQQLGILEVPRICKLETGKFEFKSKKGLLPTSIGNFFAPQEIHHTHGTRSRTRGDPPRFFSHTKKGEKSLQYIGKQIWDEIPSEIKSSESFNIFKKSYKKLLLETTVETE